MKTIEETANGLKEKRMAMIAEMKTIGEKVKTENRNLSREENEQLSRLDAEQEQLAARAETIERLERVNSIQFEDRKEKIISSPWHVGGKPYRGIEERSDAYAAWFGHGTKQSTAERRRAAERMDIDILNPTMRMDMLPWAKSPEERQRQDLEMRSTAGQLVGTNSAGGYGVAIDQSFLAILDQALKYFGDVLRYATVYDTMTGGALPLNNMDDTGANGETVGEGGTLNVLDASLARQTLNAFKYDTVVKVSTESLTDNIFDWASEIAKISGERIGRKMNSDVFVGTGSSGKSITGIMSSITTGFQSTSTIAAGPLYTDLTNMVESVDYAYQSMPSTGWVFGQAFRGLLRNILDGNDRPIIWNYANSLASGISDMLLDYKYYLHPSITAWSKTGSGSGAGNVCAIFGDLSKICVRRVRGGSEGGLVMTRLNEVYRQSGFIGFLTEARFDALYRNAGQNPIKGLESPNS